MKKMKICGRETTSSTQLQNSAFHVVERTRTAVKCTKMKKMHGRSVQNYCPSLLNMQIICDFFDAVVVVSS